MDVNPATERQFDHQHEAVIGKHADSVFVERSAMVERMGVEGNADIETCMADGEQRCLQLNSTPPIDSRDRRSGYIVVIHDDTLRRQAENRLRRQNEYLTAMQQTKIELVAQLDMPKK